jgi:hypothetical protein
MKEVSLHGADGESGHSKISSAEVSTVQGEPWVGVSQALPRDNCAFSPALPVIP